MKIKGFTITEISINMLISGIIIIFIISFISYQSKILSNQITIFGQISEIRLIQSIFSQSFIKHNLITGDENHICFHNNTPICNQEISFYPDSIVVYHPKKHVFKFKNHTNILFLQDTIISSLGITLYVNDSEHQLIYKKNYTNGTLLNIQP